MIYKELNDEIKAAMKAHNNLRRDTLRQVLNEVKNIAIAERRDVVDSDVDRMLKKVRKQLNESYDASVKAANNGERTQKFAAQIAILDEYIPKQVDVSMVFKTIDTLALDGSYTVRDMGKLMGMLNQNFAGNFDKKAASEHLKKILGK